VAESLCRKNSRKSALSPAREARSHRSRYIDVSAGAPRLVSYGRVSTDQANDAPAARHVKAAGS